MGLYRRGKTWWISFTHNGKKHRISTKTTDKRKTQEIYLEVMMQLKNPDTQKAETETNPLLYKEFYQEYLKWYSKRQKAYKTKKYFLRILPDCFLNSPLNSISTRELNLLQSQLINGRKTASVNRIMNTVKHSFMKAYEWNLISKEQYEQTQKVKLLKGEVKRLRFLSVDEIQKLLSMCDNHLYLIVFLALHTGMLKGEILNLKWEHVDLKHGLIFLEDTKNCERREIPLNEAVKDLMRRLYAKRRLDTDYIFVNPDTGKKYLDIKRSFNSACRRAGIKNFRFNDLRHTYASHLVMARVDLTTVSRLLGHKSITMTLRYSHLAPEHMSRAVDILDSHINKKSTTYLLHSLAGK